MFNLYTELPTSIDVNGNSFLIKTDFKIWLAFLDLCKVNELDVASALYMLADENDKQKAIENYSDYITALVNFVSWQPATPNTSNDTKSSPQIVDFSADAPYIYASFLQAYNLDLMSAKLHFWQFKALFLSLPSNTKMSEIMQARAYRRSADSEEKMWKRKREFWKLPVRENENDNPWGGEFDKLY